MFKKILTLLLYQPLYNILIFLAWLVPGHSLGVAIILLTLLIRLLLYPSFKKTIIHQKKMMELKPHLDRIKEEHKGDQKIQAEKTMALYREHGISPFASFLPLLIQLPILFVLYRVLLNGAHQIELNLLYPFTPHLASLNAFFFGFDLTKPDRLFLPLVAGAFQFIQSRQMSGFQAKLQGQATVKTNDFQSMLQKQMMYFLPLFTVFIAASLPASLALYWAATTAFSVLQQWWVTRPTNSSAMIPAPAEPGLPEEHKTVSKSGVEITVRKK